MRQQRTSCQDPMGRNVGPLDDQRRPDDDLWQRRSPHRHHHDDQAQMIMRQDTELVSAAHHEAGHVVATVLAFRNAAWLPNPVPPLPVRLSRSERTAAATAEALTSIR